MRRRAFETLQSRILYKPNSQWTGLPCQSRIETHLTKRPRNPPHKGLGFSGRKVSAGRSLGLGLQGFCLLFLADAVELAELRLGLV